MSTHHTGGGSPNEIIITVIIKQPPSEIGAHHVQSQTMPTLRLTGSATSVNALTKHINGYADWLNAKGNDPQYVQKATRNCRKVCLDLGWLTPADINEDDMLAYLAALKEQRRAAKTRNHYRDNLCGWCAWMKRKGIIDRNPIELVPKARVTDKVEYAVPTKDQVDALIEVARSDRRKKDRWLVYMLAAGTGLRLEEIRQLTVAMWRGGDEPRFEMPADITKSRKPQTAFVPEAVARHVEAAVEGRELADPVVQAVPKWESFERDRKAAGIPKVDKSGCKFSFHSLRHYFCNMLADADIDSETRRKLMRHGSLRMTEGVYTRANNSRLSKKINKTVYFDDDSDPDDPIHSPTMTPISPAILTGFEVGGGGSNPLTPISDPNNPQHGGVDSNAIHVGSNTPQLKNDEAERVGTILNPATGVPLSAPSSPNDSIVSASPSLRAGLPDIPQVEPGVAAPTNNPAANRDSIYAEGFSAGWLAAMRFFNGGK